VARYAGLTGSPDESGAKRREQGLARAGNARVRRGMIQLAWRFLWLQKESALVRWYQARTADSRAGHCQLKRPWYARRVGGAAARVGELLCSPIVMPRSGRAGPEEALWVR
jgi:transposase